MIARIPLVLDPQPEGGYTVTSPLLPELITEGDTIAECLTNAEDAFAVVMGVYEDEGRALPAGIRVDDAEGPVTVEAVLTVQAS
ncbi:MAG: type II toxin-antitoxin system HicB family antitoxin [Chloroflexi bacterium]|nr:type II toxin-antitoxin system HicB family antitoxin [Chloroflexota bacterium]